MAESSKFWQGTSTGDAGPYSSDSMSQVLGTIVGGSANQPNYGPLYGSGENQYAGLEVSATTPASAGVLVRKGSALVNGTFWTADADNTVPISANSSGNTRIDTIVLEKVWATQTVRLSVVQGTPAGSPVPTAMIQTDNIKWQIPLADVTVVNGFTTIATADIRPRQSYLPSVDSVHIFNCLNNSGGTLEKGDVVVWDTTAVQAVKTTSTDEDPLFAGIWQERTAAGGYGKVLVRGVTPVALTGAAASIGQRLYVSSTPKLAKLSRTAALYNAKCAPFGYVLHTGVRGTANIAYCYVNSPYPDYIPALRSYASTSNGTKNSTSSYVDITGADITVTIRSTKVRFFFMGTWYGGAGGEAGVFNIYSDGLAAYFIAGDATGAQGQGVMGIFSGLTPGSQTFRPRVRNAGVNTVTVQACYFVIEEIRE